MNTTINQFIEDLSSLSPLTSEYEMAVVSLNMYLAFLQKNSDIAYNKSHCEKTEKFIDTLKKSIRSISSKYNVSREYINNYILLFRMNKNTDEQKIEYKTKLQNITIYKIESIIDIISNINLVLNAYKQCENSYEDEHLLSNNLCISNIKSIKDYMYEYSKNISSEIEDINRAFEIIKKLNEAKK